MQSPAAGDAELQQLGLGGQLQLPAGQQLQQVPAQLPVSGLVSLQQLQQRWEARLPADRESPLLVRLLVRASTGKLWLSKFEKVSTKRLMSTTCG